MANKLIELGKLKTFLTSLKSYIAGTYVAQEQGKGLSTNDYTTAEKQKLGGIADGAQVNVVEKVKVNGADLEVGQDKSVNVTVPTDLADLSNDKGQYAKKDEIAGIKVNEAATADKLKTPVNINGVAFDGSADITITDETKVAKDTLGKANGVATLDANGQVPAAQLPSYVDDVVEYPTKADLDTAAQAGNLETGKIYVVIDNDPDTDGDQYATYRWTGGDKGALIQVGNNVDSADHAVTATKLAPGANINGVKFDGSADVTIADDTKLPLTGGALTGNTRIGGNGVNLIVENNAVVLFKTDGDAIQFKNADGSNTTGSLNAANYSGKAATAGVADTANKLATARNINGVPFDGSADITIDTTDASKVAKAGDTMTGKLTMNGVGIDFTGDGNVGTLNGVAYSGKAATAGAADTAAKATNADNAANATLAAAATKLQTARNINGVAFDGTKDVTITADVSEDNLATDEDIVALFDGPFTVTITQSDHQTITVNDGKADHTATFSAVKGTNLTATIKAADGYTAGKLNLTTVASLDGDVEFKAEAAVANK